MHHFDRKFLLHFTAMMLVVAFAAAAYDCLYADDLAQMESRAEQAREEFGVSGKGVTVVVLDRGISWDFPDFINEDGTTRIKALLDQSGQNYCSGNNPAAVEYSEAQINDALLNGTALNSVDRVGHGDSTAGVAAGNGRSRQDLKYQGIAPEADLVVVKMTSEGAPASPNSPGEVGFNGCTDEAIDWAAAKMDALGQPAVLIINSGTHAGPMDGTGSVSRKLDEVFPPDVPGRIVVLSSGDEGSLPNHSRAQYSADTAAEITFNRTGEQFTLMTVWYSGGVPAEVTLELDDGTVLGPSLPGDAIQQDGLGMYHYSPGFEPYPWKSTSGDYQVGITLTGHQTTGTVRIKARDGVTGTGTVDVYSDVAGHDLSTITQLSSHLTPGRLNDYATTRSAIITGNYNLRTSYVDRNGVQRHINHEGAVDDLWLKSSAGPTRDGRDYGVDIVAPGQGMYSPVGAGSYWTTLLGSQPMGTSGEVIRFGGTSASAPQAVGAVALMLQVNPTLTTHQARHILRMTARADQWTGAVPNTDWGYGKMDVHAAVAMALRQSFSGPWFNVLQSGHGWFVEMLDLGGGVEYLNVYWYVYLNGEPVWLIATGELSGQNAILDASITSNGQFPPDFDGADVMPWGTLSFDFNTDGTGTASWETVYPGFSSGTMPIYQLGRITGGQQGCRSGSYYNTEQSGHGIVVEMIDTGGTPSVLVAWYVYLNGKQVWLLGQADVSGDTAIIPLASYSGSGFPPAFEAADVLAEDWGTLTLLFNEDGTVSASWQTTRPGYTSGNLELVRLTGLGGHDCSAIQ